MYYCMEIVNCKVYLAMEAGYSEKVDELCDRYSLEGFFERQRYILSMLVIFMCLYSPFGFGHLCDQNCVYIFYWLILYTLFSN